MPTFFRSQSELRRWLEAHHDTARELWVGFYKKHAKREGITYAEAVDEALCFGWIDGVRKSVDDSSYMNRFTPRKPRSIWSAVNIKRVGELAERGRMRPPGLAAFAARDEARSRVYAYEQRSQGLGPEYEREFRANERAWTFFEAQPPWYRRTSAWWVVSAKKEETRRRRLAALIECSAQGATIPQLTRPSRPARKTP
jgi:uncharacterized protein YdeI (YjbR/CyaY-like superfamily)